MEPSFQNICCKKTLLAEFKSLPWTTNQAILRTQFVWTLRGHTRFKQGFLWLGPLWCMDGWQMLNGCWSKSLLFKKNFIFKWSPQAQLGRITTEVRVLGSIPKEDLWRRERLSTPRFALRVSMDYIVHGDKESDTTELFSLCSWIYNVSWALLSSEVTQIIHFSSFKIFFSIMAYLYIDLYSSLCYNSRALSFACPLYIIVVFPHSSHTPSPSLPHLTPHGKLSLLCLQLFHFRDAFLSCHIWDSRKDIIWHICLFSLITVHNL